MEGAVVIGCGRREGTQEASSLEVVGARAAGAYGQGELCERKGRRWAGAGAEAGAPDWRRAAAGEPRE